jgi:hypothetical protein
VQLTNWTSSSLTVSSVQTTGPFTQVNNCKQALAANGVGDCNVNVTYKPETVGISTGTLTINDSDTGSPQQVVSLSGNATTVNLTPYYPGINFGTVRVGKSSTQTATLTNTGTTALSISSVQVIGPVSQTNTCGSSVAAGTSCTFSLTYTPTTSDVLYGNLVVYGSAPGSPYTTRIKGIGTAVQYAPQALTFGSVNVGSSSTPLNITITNTGSTPLVFGTLATTANFTQTNNCTSVAAGARCVVKVTFSPTTSGSLTGLLTLNDSDEDAPQVLNLSGTGAN